MNAGTIGVAVFVVLVIAFVAYILAAAIRDKKMRRADAADGAGDGPLPVSEGVFCPHCMEKREEEQATCPFCGRAYEVADDPRLLPAGTVLGGRYIAGVPLRENRAFVTYVCRDNYLETRHCLREYFPREIAVRGESGEVVPADGAREVFEEGKTRFARDARLLGRLTGISSAAGVTDLIFANGTVYVVAGYFAGRTLTNYLRENGSLSPEYALALFAPVIRQLEAEEAMGLIRCSLSADSFYWTDEGLKLEGTGIPGGAVAAFPAPGFAPEELYRKSGVPGAWTDVYSVCAVIYLCLTGMAPPEASERVYQDGLRAPSSLGIYLSAAFEESLMKGLNVYQEDRFPDCAALFGAIYCNKIAGAGAGPFVNPIIDPVGGGVPDDPFGAMSREPVDNDIV